MNILESWKEFALLEKWKRVKHDDPYFSSIRQIYEELSEFFNKEDFDVTNISSLNWLAHILYNKQRSSIWLINEIAELIRYFRTLDNNKAYGLITKRNKINYRELREKLFELYINYTLKKVGLNPEIGQQYYDSKGNVKTIDIYLSFQGLNYNIETTNLYDHVADELFGLTMFIQRKIYEKSNNKNIKPEELFSGYFAFKKLDADLIKNQKQLFEKSIKDYFHSFRYTPDNTIKQLAKTKNDNFEFVLESSFLEKYNTEYDKFINQFPASIKFKLFRDFPSHRITADVKFSIREEIKVKNELLFNKIVAKIKQHRDYKGKILIVIEISNVFSTHHKESKLAIKKKNINIPKIKEALNKNVMALLVFKELGSSYMKYDHLSIFNDNQHVELAKIIETFDWYIIYSIK